MSATPRSFVPDLIARPANRLSILATSSDVGPLLIRAMLGVVFAFHGAQKLFGWFGGYGIEATARAFESMGIPLPTLNVYLAGGAEFFGGLFLIIGLLTRPWALILAFTMFVASFTAHGSAFSLQHNGMEYALTLAIMSLALAFIGAGRISLDRTLKLPAA